MSAATQWESTPAVRDEAPRRVACGAITRSLSSRVMQLRGIAEKGLESVGTSSVIGRIPTSCSDGRIEIFFQLHHFFQPPPGPLLQRIDLFDRGSHEPRDVARRQGLAGREHHPQVEPLIERKIVRSGLDGWPRATCDCAFRPRAADSPPAPVPSLRTKGLCRRRSFRRAGRHRPPLAAHARVGPCRLRAQATRRSHRLREFASGALALARQRGSSLARARAVFRHAGCSLPVTTSNSNKLAMSSSDKRPSGGPLIAGPKQGYPRLAAFRLGSGE